MPLDYKASNNEDLLSELYEPHKLGDLVPYFGLKRHHMRYREVAQSISKLDFERQKKEWVKLIRREIPVGLALTVYHGIVIILGAGLAGRCVGNFFE